MSPAAGPVHGSEWALPLDCCRTFAAFRARRPRSGLRISFPVEVRVAAGRRLAGSTSYGRPTGYIAVHCYARDPARDYFRGREIAVFTGSRAGRTGASCTRWPRPTLRERYPRFDDSLALRARLDPERPSATPTWTAYSAPSRSETSGPSFRSTVQIRV